MFTRLAGDSWMKLLSDEDVTFLKRFVLASGSLKDQAAAYGVSYPTIRARLDRLIEKVRFLDRKRNTGPFENQLLTLYAEGKLNESTMRKLLSAHEEEMAKGAQQTDEAGAGEQS